MSDESRFWAGLQGRLFLEKLNRSEREFRRLSDFDRDFVLKMRKQYENRADPIEFGKLAWEPSVKQINYLREVYNKVES